MWYMKKIIDIDVKTLGAVDGYGLRGGNVTQEGGVGRGYMSSRFKELSLDDVDNVVAISPHMDDAALGLNGLFYALHERNFPGTYKHKFSFMHKASWNNVRRADEYVFAQEEVEAMFNGKPTKLYLVNFSTGWAGVPGQIAKSLKERIACGKEQDREDMTPEAFERVMKIGIKYETDEEVCTFIDADAMFVMYADIDQEDYKIRMQEEHVKKATDILKQCVTGDKTIVALPHLGEGHGVHKTTTAVFWEALAEFGAETGKWPRVLEYGVWDVQTFKNRFLPVNRNYTDRLLALYDDQAAKFPFTYSYREMVLAKQLQTAALIESDGRRHMKEPIGPAEPYIALETENEGKLDNRFVKIRAETGLEAGSLMDLVSRGLSDKTLYEFADALRTKGVKDATEVLKTAELLPIKDGDKIVKRNPLPSVLTVQVPIYLE
jgi:hypothetical protein